MSHCVKCKVEMPICSVIGDSKKISFGWTEFSCKTAGTKESSATLYHRRFYLCPNCISLFSDFFSLFNMITGKELVM